MMLNEMATYINHLHELRRINEGSDTNDAPGYALDLVRVPVSVLPGKKTREGYGAEITITATPHVTTDPSPTFKSLVENDLVDLLAPPLTQWVNDPDITEAAKQILLYDQAKDNQYAQDPCKMVHKLFPGKALTVLHSGASARRRARRRGGPICRCRPASWWRFSASTSWRE